MAADDESYNKIIISRFMNELNRRDTEDNRENEITDGLHRNVFPIEEVRQAVLNAFGLEAVMLALRGYILHYRDNEPIELLDNDTDVQLTDAGCTMRAFEE